MKLLGTPVKPILREALRAGTIAGLAMIPLGLLFSGLGLRINEYGHKLVQLFFGQFPKAVRLALFVLEYFVVSWMAAIPLLLLLVRYRRPPPLMVGLLYGLGFYGLVNSLLLPLAFGDPSPWKLGIATVAPSLLVHLVYGGALALSARVSSLKSGEYSS